MLNALTGAGVGVGERLFHTLDPTTRAYRHRGRRYLVTDTVGFIRKLPHQLVEAFKATLEETVLADLIVHVVDASEPERRGARRLRRWTRSSRRSAPTRRRGCSSSTRSTCWTPPTPGARIEEPTATLVSAADRRGAGRLRDRIGDVFEESLREVELLLPYSEGGMLAELHELAGDLEREDRAEGVVVRARIPEAVAHRFADFALNGAARGPGPDGTP